MGKFSLSRRGFLQAVGITPAVKTIKAFTPAVLEKIQFDHRTAEEKAQSGVFTETPKAEILEVKAPKYNASLMIDGKEVGEVRAITSQPIQREMIDVTSFESLDSTGGYRQFIAGFNPGNLSVSLRMEEDDLRNLNEAFMSGEVSKFELTLPDADRTRMEFEGLIVETPIEFNPDESEILADIQIRIATAVSMDLNDVEDGLNYGKVKSSHIEDDSEWEDDWNDGEEDGLAENEVECPTCGEQFETFPIAPGECPTCGHTYGWEQITPDRFIIDWDPS